MQEYLEKLKIVDQSSIQEYFPSVRDNAEIKVYKCNASGVIFLKEKTHDNAYYAAKRVSLDVNRNLESLAAEEVYLPANADDQRRAIQFSSLIKGKKWLDFGCGTGRLIDLLKNIAERAEGCELNSTYVNAMKERNIEVYSLLADVPQEAYDVITMFHVLEHIPNPLETLQQLFVRLKKGGVMVIEIPHANDFLLKSLDLHSFKKFTFWSEHLVLYTRNALEILLQNLKPLRISIKAFQRYSLDNHLYWLRYNKPGGHDSFLRDIVSQNLRDNYENFLISIDQTDSLIAFVYKS